jgi:acetolactate decarboxylase
LRGVKKKVVWLLVSTLLQLSCTTNLQEKGDRKNRVTMVGMMRNVMMRGELSGTIDLDTIADKKHLYGMGPVEFLTGEILVLDGVAYQSAVETDSTMRVTETYQLKAPFFAYANISEWEAVNLPDSIHAIQQLEQYLQQTTSPQSQPFFFQLVGVVEKARIHVVNLPPGTTVSSPEEAHAGQRNYTLENEAVEILGFYSTKHKAIFTHHDTFLHMHLITADRKWMGHVDYLEGKPGSLKLYLPKP